METNPVNPQTQGDELLAKAKANKGKLTGALIFCIVVVVPAFATRRPPNSPAKPTSK